MAFSISVKFRWLMLYRPHLEDKSLEITAVDMIKQMVNLLNRFQTKISASYVRINLCKNLKYCFCNSDTRDINTIIRLAVPKPL